MKPFRHYIGASISALIWIVALPLVIIELIGIAANLTCRQISKLTARIVRYFDGRKDK